jgi:hypothetical protein
VTLPANIINYEVIPSGGIVSLLFESSDIHGTWTITREGNGQTITLYQGPPMGTTNGTAYKWLYLDLGDGTNLPLNALQPYTYTFASTNAPSGVEVITPACSLVISQDGYLAIFMRCLQAGCNNIQLPIAGTGKIRPATIQIAMPLTGAPTMPLITVAPLLLQQKNVPIGHTVNSDYQKNEYGLYEQVMRRYSVTVLAETPLERDFYAAAVVTVFKAVIFPVLNNMGQNVTTDFQVSYAQIVDPQPGFYMADVSLDFQGNMIASVSTSYGPVTAIDPVVNAPGTTIGTNNAL